MQRPLFVIVFVAFWMTISTALMLFSGWLATARKYPDRDEAHLFTLSAQSGFMNGVGLNMMLQFRPCPSGLRLRALKLFFPLAKTIFVPWSEINVTRKRIFTFHRVEIAFGSPPVSRLSIDAAVADRLAKGAGVQWPEALPAPPVNVQSTKWDIFVAWLFQTTLASAFFIIVPHLVSKENASPSPILAVTLSALVIGTRAVITLWGVTRSDHKL